VRRLATVQTSLTNREAFYSVHFHIAIIVLILQRNAHVQLNICIVYYMFPTCFVAQCAIHREKSFHFLNPACCMVVTVVELQSVRYMWVFLQNCLQLLKQYCLICGLKVFLHDLKKPLSKAC
jgi:hypothetical protein